jgi:hypothetical protein
MPPAVTMSGKRQHVQHVRCTCACVPNSDVSAGGLGEAKSPTACFTVRRQTEWPGLDLKSSVRWITIAPLNRPEADNYAGPAGRHAAAEKLRHAHTTKGVRLLHSPGRCRPRYPGRCMHCGSAATGSDSEPLHRVRRRLSLMLQHAVTRRKTLAGILPRICQHQSDRSSIQRAPQLQVGCCHRDNLSRSTLEYLEYLDPIP